MTGVPHGRVQDGLESQHTACSRKNLPSYPEGYSQDILLLLLCIHSFIHLLGSEGPKATYKSQNTVYNNHSVAHVVKSLTKVKRYDNRALHPGVWSEAA